MQRASTYTNRCVRALIAGLAVLITLAFFGYSPYTSAIVSSQVKRRSARAGPRKYSEFPHSVKAHQIACSTCHKFPSPNWNKVRSEAAAFPDVTDYPKHESCLGCHRQQFYRGTPPVICSICHTNPGPRDSSRHPFPNPREIYDSSKKGKTASSDFAISFPHDKHIEIVTASGAQRSTFRYASFKSRPAAEESCKVCHTNLLPQGDSDAEYMTPPPKSIGDGFWLKKGAFKSVPTGHTTCFTCHSTDTGLTPAPTDCNTCHKLKPPMPAADFDLRLASQIGIEQRVILDAWKRRDSSGTFRHEFSIHNDLSCDTCHTVGTINTLDPKSKRVSVTACATCHVTATVDDGGAMNFEVQSRKTDAKFQCTKCHIVFGSQAIPQSHIQAIIDAGGKP